MTADIHIPNIIPKKHTKKIKAALSSPESFFKLMKIIDKQTQGLIPFVMNPEQKRLLEVLKTKNKVIILKPRQIGVSTLLRAYAFWRAYTSKHAGKWGVISFHERSAKHLRRMDSTFHENLPLLLRRKLAIENTTDFEFEDTRSSMCSYTAGSKGGTRSFTLTSAHLSEFAYYDNPGSVLASTTATLPKDGKLIIESTPKGCGDLFHQLCVGSPDNGWTLVCFWWWEHAAYRSYAGSSFEPTPEEEVLAARYGLHPDQLQWRREQIGTIGAEDFRREYPGCLEDAFYAGDSVYFDGDKLDSIEAVAMRGDRITFQEPEEDNCYVIGVDVAAGVNKDYSVITVASAIDNQIVYVYRSNKISPSGFSDIVYKVACKYNDAFTLIESNNHGHLILDRLKMYGYTNLWCDARRRDWVTSLHSKVKIYEILREYIHNQMILKMPDVMLLELRSLIVEKVAPEAPRGMHDDMAMSLALCYRALRDIPAKQIRSQKMSLMDQLISKQRKKRITEHAYPWKKTL